MIQRRTLAERRDHQRRTGDPRFPFYFGSAITVLSALSITLAILTESGFDLSGRPRCCCSVSTS